MYRYRAVLLGLVGVLVAVNADAHRPVFHRTAAFLVRGTDSATEAGPLDYTFSMTFPVAATAFEYHLDDLTVSSPDFYVITEDNAGDFGVDWPSLLYDFQNRWTIGEWVSHRALVETPVGTFEPICCTGSTLTQIDSHDLTAVSVVVRTFYQSQIDDGMRVTIETILNAGVAYPEPSSLVLCLLAGPLLLRLRRR